MFIHLMTHDEKFNGHMVKYIESFTEPSLHKFFIFYSGYIEKQIDSSNLEYCNFFSLKQYIVFIQKYKYDSIIFHNLFYGARLFIALLLYGGNLNRCNWIIFGGDLYDYKERKLNLKKYLIFFLKKLCVSKFGYITTLTDGDYQLAKKYYSVTGKNFVVVYGDSKTTAINIKNTLGFINKASFKYSGRCRILVGNSATSTNAHDEIFQLLKKFALHDIEIYVSLSYGDPIYRDKIIKLGKEIFGDKFIPVLDFMPYNIYVKFIQTMHVAIFNSNRQQALGNINLSNFLGVKTYIRSDTTMWEYYKLRVGVVLFDILDIPNLCFADFLHYDVDLRKKNIFALYRYYENKERTEEWRKMFDAMKINSRWDVK